MTTMLKFDPDSTYVEIEKPGLSVRYQRLEPCDVEGCGCTVDPTVVVFAGHEPRWLGCFGSSMSEVEEAIERIEERPWIRTMTCAELVGVPWHVVEQMPQQVLTDQTIAVLALPPRLREAPREQAAACRNAIVDIGDPKQIASMLRALEPEQTDYAKRLR